MQLFRVVDSSGDVVDEGRDQAEVVFAMSVIVSVIVSQIIFAMSVIVTPMAEELKQNQSGHRE